MWAVEDIHCRGVEVFMHSVEGQGSVFIRILAVEKQPPIVPKGRDARCTVVNIVEDNTFACETACRVDHGPQMFRRWICTSTAGWSSTFVT
jgi:hypothetical protein